MTQPSPALTAPSACARATRPHEHLYSPATGEPSGRIIAMSRDRRSWRVNIADDGSICDRYVTPVPPRWAPERVIALLLTERGYVEAAERRNNPRPMRKGRRKI